MYEVELFRDDRGVCPFLEWLEDVKDIRARAKILARLRRASEGNFGDWKRLENADGIFEMREPYGPGFRIYYALMGRKIVIVLAGSTKRDQDRAIVKAQKYLGQHKRGDGHAKKHES